MDLFTHNDQPITRPSEDIFGINPFAHALARSIRNLRAPNGTVVAVNGPWGSGKSSVINLVRHHLADAVENEEIVIIDFSCWWFRGEEALALAFFRELYAGLTPSLGDKIKKALPKLGARLLRSGPLIGGAADAAGAGGIGAAAGGMLERLGNLIEQDESVEKLHAEISKALSEQPKRFLIVIDDIDRLSPEEALLIFRLVKSVGRLPNVMYLLAYDRQLAEKIVSERYPSEGPHYLEKIVQAAFELPEPSPTDIQQHLLTLIESICGTPEEGEMVRFMNIFHEGVAPSMRTPRDVARFTNSLSITWSAVSGEVNIADYLALEILRLLHPSIYRSIRQNKNLMCISAQSIGRDRKDIAQQFNRLLAGSDAELIDKRLRNLLMRLFPVLESAWSNISYGNGFNRRWAQERRVCSPEHFDSYFRFTISDDTLSRVELDAFLDQADDPEYVKGTLRRSLTETRRSGGTKAAVWLTELTAHAERVEHNKLQPLLTALFEVLDEINIEADEEKAFSIGSNELRLHWLLRALTKERMSLEERSAMFMQACATASLGWLADFTRSAWNDHHPREAQVPEPPENCLTTETDAAQLRNLLLSRIEAASSDGSLIKHRQLPFLLYFWVELANDDGAAVHAWTSAMMSTDDGIHKLAKAFTSYGWTQGMGFTGLGDLVARRITRVSPKGMASVIDIEAFRKRVEAISATSGEPDIQEFLEAWQRADRGVDD